MSRVQQLSQHGYLVHDVFESVLYNQIVNHAQSAVHGSTRPGAPDSRREVCLIKGALRSQILESIQPVVSFMGNSNVSVVESWRDYPGYQNPHHIDESTLSAVFIIYLEPGANGTDYTENQINYIAPFEPNTGLLLLNSDKIQHGMTGTVAEDVVRHTLYISWSK